MKTAISRRCAHISSSPCRKHVLAAISLVTRQVLAVSRSAVAYVAVRCHVRCLTAVTYVAASRAVSAGSSRSSSLLHHRPERLPHLAYIAPARATELSPRLRASSKVPPSSSSSSHLALTHHDSKNLQQDLCTSYKTPSPSRTSAQSPFPAALKGYNFLLPASSFQLRSACFILLALFFSTDCF